MLCYIIDYDFGDRNDILLIYMAIITLVFFYFHHFHMVIVFSLIKMENEKHSWLILDQHKLAKATVYQYNYVMGSHPNSVF